MSFNFSSETDVTASKMKSVVILLTFLVVSSYGKFILPAEIYEGDLKTEALERFLRWTLENLREHIKVGIPMIKLPPADPLNWKSERVQVNNSQVELDFKLHEIKVVGLSSFRVPKLNANLGTLTLDARFRLPSVTLSGSYQVNGTFMKLIPLYGDGSYKITVTGAEMAAKTILTSNGKDFVILPLVLDLDWQDIKVDLGNFLGGGDFALQVQRLLPELSKTFFQESKPKIMALASRGLTKIINSELQKEEVKKALNNFIPALTG